MTLLDTNIVLISLPTILRKLPDTSTVDALWIIMGYTLVISTVLLTFGRLSDIYGRIKMYKAGFAVFTIASGLCSISFDGSALVFFRLVQGIGAALLYANSTAIITDAFPLSERGRALGISQVGGISGSLIGLVAGGLLTVTLGWPSIFWVNVPFGTYATIWAHLKMKEQSIQTKGDRPDIVGMTVFGAGLAIALAGVVFGSLYRWPPVDVSLIGIGLALIFAFIYLERKIRAPMMDLKLFRVREFSAGILGNLLAAISRGALSFVLVFYFQGVLLFDALRAGLMLIPFSLAFVTVGPVSGALSDKYGSRLFATLGMTLSTISFVWFSSLPENTQYDVFVLPMILTGIGGGLFFSPNISSIMSSVPINRRGIASGMSSTLFNVGFLMSLGISFAFLATSVPNNILQEIFAGLPVPSGAIDLGNFVNATHEVFRFMAAISAIAAVAAYFGRPKPRLTQTTSAKE